MAKKKLIKQLIFTFLILTLSICILLPVIKNTKLGLDLQGGYEDLGDRQAERASASKPRQRHVLQLQAGQDRGILL